MDCLFHEKPFAGINGSGKHVNFSLGNTPPRATSSCRGDDAHDNAQFLVFCAASHPRRPQVRRDSLRAVGGLGRERTTTGCGADEAPSGHHLRSSSASSSTDVFDQIAHGGATALEGEGAPVEIGVDTLPVLPTDPGDRNRTSPVRVHRATGSRLRGPGLAPVDRRDRW